MAELELVESLPEENLVLPIKLPDGTVKKYEIKPVSAEWWYRFAALRQMWVDQENKAPSSPDDQAAVKELDKLGHSGLQVVALGRDVAAKMLKDGVTSEDFRRAVNTAYMWHASGGNDEAAAAVWSGKAKSPSTSASTGAASTTKRPASGTRTTSRKTSRKS